MLYDKKYFKWCVNQKKGIKLVKESENLKKASKTQLRKARSTLKSLG